MNRKIDIRIITPDMHPVKSPVLLVRLREGDWDRAYQLRLRGTAPQEVAKDIQHAVQKLLSRHEVSSVVHGHWEYWEGWRGNHDRRIAGATCSVCGYEHPTVYGVEDPKKSLSPLCPVCGAVMDERKKEDTLE